MIFVCFRCLEVIRQFEGPGSEPFEIAVLYKIREDVEVVEIDGVIICSGDVDGEMIFEWGCFTVESKEIA